MQVEDAWKYYDLIVALNSVSLNISEGELIGLVGDNSVEVPYQAFHIMRL